MPNATGRHSSRRDVTKQGMKAVFAALRSRVDGSKDEAPQVAVPARFSIWPSFIGVRSALVPLQPMGIRWHGSVAIASSTAATCACLGLHANLLVTGNACHANTTNTASLPWTRGSTSSKKQSSRNDNTVRIGMPVVFGHIGDQRQRALPCQPVSSLWFRLQAAAGNRPSD